MRWFKYTVIVFTQLFLLALVVPFLIQLDRYIPSLEKLNGGGTRPAGKN